MNNEKLKAYLRGFLRESTAAAYHYRIVRFIKENPQGASYTYQKLMEYVEILRKNYAPTTVHAIVAVLKTYYDYLIKTGRRKDNPAGAIRFRDYKNPPVQLQDLFSGEELESLLVPRKEFFTSLTTRNEIILSLLIYQGLKADEIIQLKISDIDLAKARLKVSGTTKTNARVLPLEARQIYLFHTYLEKDRLKLLRFSKKRQPEPDAFLLNKEGAVLQKRRVLDLINYYQKKTGKNLTPGSIRQSVIANLLNKGTDLRIVQEFAGHKYLDSTEKYKEKGLKALQTAIEKHHPLK